MKRKILVKLVDFRKQILLFAFLLKYYIIMYQTRKKNMKKAKYLIVDSGDVIKNNYSYPTPSIISVSLSPLNEIFDDNNIPREFQKLIIQVDSLFYGNPLLFKEWKDNDFIIDLIPSIDRIDCMKPYSFDNMQLLTWKQNKEKYNNIERQKHKLDDCEYMICKTRRKVQQLDMDGNFIKEFISMSEAARQTNSIASCICECCQGKRKSTKGYRWKYV